ncbi:MAG: malonyl-CoA decarboxylase domain-containing protein, partial [bacterium]
CARYFYATRADGTPIDPVARFHLRNGARIEAIHAEADLSPKGLRQSLGLMVNYRYDPESLESNQATYETEQEIHAASHVRGLLD